MKGRRCFIALEITEPVVSAVAELLQLFRQAGAEVRWVRPETLHLTVKFLGELREPAVDEVRKVLRSVVPRHPVFSVKISGIGGFPSLRRPKVLWAGVSSLGELTEFQSDLDGELARSGFEADSRPYVPHLTLGRIRSGLSESLPGLQEMAAHVFGKVEFRQVVLKESRLSASGPDYADLLRVDLRMSE